MRQVLWGLPLPGLWHRVSIGCGLVAGEGADQRGSSRWSPQQLNSTLFLLFHPPRFRSTRPSAHLCPYLHTMAPLLRLSSGLPHPGTYAHCWLRELLSAQAQSPLAMHRATGYPAQPGMRRRGRNGKALKWRPSANVHLPCHLASFSPGHMEPVSVGLDFSIRSEWSALGGGRC